MGKYGHKKPPQLVIEIFNEIAENRDVMNAKQFCGFLRKWQGIAEVTEELAANIISKTTSSGTFDLHGFFNYLLDPTQNSAMGMSSTTHDMTAPLPHYYIHTSHNSYLRGNQLTSKSCTSPIISALHHGCRVIELDCWNRSGKIMVLHGGTLTKAVPFDSCIQAIKENAFVASEFPVIITIENHLPPDLQQQAAKILKDVIGDMLYIPPRDTLPKEFLSPFELMRKIIISDKPPAENIGKQVATDPQGAIDAIPPNDLRSSSSSDFDSSSSDDEAESSLKHKVDKKMKRRIQKTANDLAEARLSDEEMLQQPLKVPELQELLYIYCAKLSEMENVPVNGELVKGENAIMANMSEPQLKKSVSLNPASIIQYTKTNLGRMYPFGLRFDSSNADPMLAWSHGFQLAAMNLQGKDKACWLTHAFFSANGGCGYVKKPHVFTSDVNHTTADITPSKLLKVRVLMGTDWHKKFEIMGKPDFYVKVALHGIAADKTKKRTQVAHNCDEPNWEGEEFEFPLRVPEIAVVRFEAWEHDRMRRDDFVGQACYPVEGLKCGIRSIALKTRRGEVTSSKLLCHISVTQTS